MTENIKIKYAGPSVEDVCFSVTTSGSVGTVHAVFSFDEEWDEFPTKTAIFAADTVVKQVLLDGENSCPVPWEVLEEGGYIEVGVVGQNGEKIFPSTKTNVHIFEGIYTEGTEPEDPTPSIYEQIVQIMQQTLSVAQSVREDADAGKFDGKDGDDYILTEADKKEISEKTANALILTLWEYTCTFERIVFVTLDGKEPVIDYEGLGIQPGGKLRKVDYLDVAGLRVDTGGVVDTLSRWKQSVLLTDYSNSKSSGDFTAMLGFENRNSGNGNIVGGIKNSFTGRAGLMTGNKNTVDACAEGAIIGGTNQVVNDATVQMALNNFRLHNDGTMKLAGKIVATEESMKKYIDETLLGGAW